MFSSKLKTGFLLALVLTASIVFSGCSESSYSDNDRSRDPLFEEEKSSLSRVKSQENLEDIIALSELNNDFAIGFYKQISGNEGNLIFSPYSISLAMAMLYAGAAGETQKQISDVFNFPIPQDSLHPLFNALDFALASRGKGAKGLDGDGFRLCIANQLFMQDRFNVIAQYLDTLALYYGAGVGILDFENKPDESASTINRWIEDKTNGLMKDVVNKSSIQDIKLALVNTIYFNAAWDKIFDESYTDKRDFFPEYAPAVKVDMMHQTGAFPYFIGEEFSAIDLPYDGKELSMLVIVPKASCMSAFEENLTTEVINVIIDSLNTDRVVLSFPKFKYSSASLDLGQILKAMGMPEPFSDNADFSGINGAKNLKINNIIHRALIDVNEKGTKAAAVTVIGVGTTCMPDEINVNRPFIFIIRDISTHAILFMGRVSKP